MRSLKFSLRSSTHCSKLKLKMGISATDLTGFYWLVDDIQLVFTWLMTLQGKLGNNRSMLFPFPKLSVIPYYLQPLITTQQFNSNPGADPENRSWGGHRDQRAISPRAPTCAVWIQGAFGPKSGALCQSWGGAWPLWPPHWISPWNLFVFHLKLAL